MDDLVEEISCPENDQENVIETKSGTLILVGYVQLCLDPLLLLLARNYDYGVELAANTFISYLFPIPCYYRHFLSNNVHRESITRNATLLSDLYYIVAKLQVYANDTW